MRTLVITGADGDFCAGADLSEDEMPGDSAADNLKNMWHPAAAASTLHRLTKPTVAAVDGVAVGAGMNLALGYDVVIATEAARFAEIFVRRGLTLDFGGTWLLPRLVGLARARELALTGREVDAVEALEIGLVARVVPVAQLRAEAAATAEALAAGAPLAQSFVKQGLGRSSSMTFEQAIRFEDQVQAVLLATEDFNEAVTAFSERRPPDFRGR
jgi:2-(1,2-epoxy-1,2-dihydrophenyl)acetyl-CoA isomerase